MNHAPSPIDAPGIGEVVGINVIERSIKAIEGMLHTGSEHVSGETNYAELRESLSQLHTFVRTRQAMDLLADDTLSGQSIPPEFADQVAALRCEYSTILGSLDRAIRASRSMTYQPLEDQDVFNLRIREALALIRRHEAEKDRLLSLAVWQETGGES